MKRRALLHEGIAGIDNYGAASLIDGMNRRREVRGHLVGEGSDSKGEDRDFTVGAYSSRGVFGAFWAILFTASFFVAGSWTGFHGVLFACASLLIWLRPPEVSLPRHWWILAASFLFLAASVFLPSGWFPSPGWRKELETIGVDTGCQVVIQARQAAEVLALFAIMLLTGLWLAGHRASPSQLRLWALVFTVGIACYAIVSRIMQDSLQMYSVAANGHFGFFPNRNHTATYLAMGAICGLGCVIQALRDKRVLPMLIALAATGVCLWAAAAWSVSRAGVVLVALGALVWLPMLGRRYLGKHGLWAFGLLSLTALGLFFIADSNVKQRFSNTVAKAGSVIDPTDELTTGKGSASGGSLQDLDFRIPTALDTLDLIRDFKWSGVGAGQYYFVFPQYKKLTAAANDTDSFHPESDWLWMAAEAGIPATLALAALVVLALRKSQLAILHGRDRGLRSACLVAAMLVPLHGVFDVPGHRITLAWGAAFLFALSLQAPSPDCLTAPPRAWPSRILALTLLAVAAFLIRAQWPGQPQPAFTTARVALTQAQRLYCEDLVLQRAAVAEGRIHQPDPAGDRLEKALSLLSQAAPAAPLDRDLLRYQAFLSLHFDDKFDQVDRLFAIDRALDPAWVAGPLRQAQCWIPIAPRRAVALWNEALRRAKALDRTQPGNQWSSERTLQRIQQSAKGMPDLEKLIPSP